MNRAHRTRRRINCARSGFTLIEILIASIAAVIILAAIYGVFVRALKMRDSAAERVRESRLRIRAANVIRTDLRNALISGTNGIIAVVLEGGRDGSSSRFPGYLRFTTTTGKNAPDEMLGDVQQVEYYIRSDAANSGRGDAGTLVRAVNRNLLATVQEVTREEPILTGVKAIDVSFFDGQSWQETWQYTADNPVIPEAVRIDVQRAGATDTERAPEPLEILVPWNTQPWTSGTASTSGTTTTTGT